MGITVSHFLHPFSEQGVTTINKNEKEVITLKHFNVFPLLHLMFFYREYPHAKFPEAADGKNNWSHCVRV